MAIQIYMYEMKQKNNLEKNMTSYLLDISDCGLVTTWSENEVHVDATLILIVLFCLKKLWFCHCQSVTVMWSQAFPFASNKRSPVAF